MKAAKSLIPIRSWFPATLAAVALCSCGAGISTTEVWTESVVAVWGGTIQATQGDGSVAYSRPDMRSLFEKLGDWMNPLPEAMAAVPDCPTVVGASCGTSGTTLQLFNNNCFGKSMTSPLYRRHYVTWEFPSNGDCLAVTGSGFGTSSGTLSSGQIVTRGYGASNSNQASDQENFALASNSELNAVYTVFPSGFTGDARVGGIDVTFVDANTRKITIRGVHIQGDANPNTIFDNAGTFDLGVEGQNGQGVNHLWDHTLNTVKNGDTIMESGPPLKTSGTGVAWNGDNVGDNPKSPADADAIVVGFGSGATLRAGAAVRTQHNHSTSVGISVVEQDLVFSDSKCCWPTSGKIHTEFDRFYNGDGKMPWPYEDLTFGPGCGDITYETSEGDTGVTKLHHCY